MESAWRMVRQEQRRLRPAPPEAAARDLNERDASALVLLSSAASLQQVRPPPTLCVGMDALQFEVQRG